MSKMYNQDEDNILSSSDDENDNYLYDIDKCLDLRGSLGIIQDELDP